MKESRETFAGRRRTPELWGLERAALYPIAGAWTTAAMLLTFLHQRHNLSWTATLIMTGLPATCVTVVCLFLVQGKPPGYFMNWVEENVLGGRHFTPRKRVPPHPIHDPRHQS